MIFSSHKPNSIIYSRGQSYLKTKTKKPATTQGTVWELNLEEGQRKGRGSERNVSLETTAQEAPGQSGPG